VISTLNRCLSALVQHRVKTTYLCSAQWDDISAPILQSKGEAIEEEEINCVKHDVGTEGKWKVLIHIFNDK